MIYVFKSWVSSMLCIGIFVTFITLIIPKNKMRKYIYSLIGVVTIFTLVSPVIKFVNTGAMDEAVNEVLDNVSVFSSNDEYNLEKYKEKSDDLVQKDFVNSLKKDVTSKLSLQNVVVKDVEVFLAKNYDIEKIEVRIKKLTDKKRNGKCK